jgi:hypothetical protein
LNFRAAIQIFAGDVRLPAGDLNFPRTLQIFSGKFVLSLNFSIVPLKFQISGGAHDVRLKI